MVARAGRDYDVLLVGYVSRFARNLRTAVNAQHDLHAAGASILFCDERVLSSDEDEWEAWARETVEAEAYSRRLGKRIREGYAAKYRRLSDPGGFAPLGFRRTSDRPRTLEIDPESIDVAVALFVGYASGDVSIEELARSREMNDRTVNDILKNPIYNGWVQRKGDRTEAPWRSEPPVDDFLWSRVQELMAARSRGGGPRIPDRPDLLRGLLRCACGSTIRASGVMRGRHRRLHSVQPCPEGVTKKLWDTQTWLAPIEAQVAEIRLDAPTMDEVVQSLGEMAQQPAPVDLERLEHRRRRLGESFAAGEIGERELIVGMRRLKEEAAAAPRPRVGLAVSEAAAIAYIRQFAISWASARPQSRASLLRTIYREIVVRGDEFISIFLTDEAYAHGLAAVMPLEVEVPVLPSRGRPRKSMALARPTGVGRALATYEIPIEGRDEWLAAAGLSA